MADIKGLGYVDIPGGYLTIRQAAALTKEWGKELTAAYLLRAIKRGFLKVTRGLCRHPSDPQFIHIADLSEFWNGPGLPKITRPDNKNRSKVRDLEMEELEKTEFLMHYGNLNETADFALKNSKNVTHSKVMRWREEDPEFAKVYWLTGEERKRRANFSAKIIGNQVWAEIADTKHRADLAAKRIDGGVPIYEALEAANLIGKKERI